MKPRTVRRLAAGALAAAVVAAAPAVARAGGDADVNRDLAAARAATAKYHDEATAVADGFDRTDTCVSSPAGAMGYHYAKPAHFQGALDVRRPQVLLYQPRPDGSRKLVGVEYVVFDADQDLATDDDRPTLFGRPFNGPMEGHEPGMPRHYDLHVWVWQHNPAGMFEDWNPAGRC
jgi:hypothetical protein